MINHLQFQHLVRTTLSIVFRKSNPNGSVKYKSNEELFTISTFYLIKNGIIKSSSIWTYSYSTQTLKFLILSIFYRFRHFVYVFGWWCNLKICNNSTKIHQYTFFINISNLFTYLFLCSMYIEKRNLVKQKLNMKFNIIEFFFSLMSVNFMIFIIFVCLLNLF